jgi:hypothetical protein
VKLSPADIAFSRCVRAANNHTCEKCGIHKPPTGTRGSDGLECSHRYGRRSRTVRWCKENADCLCSACHRYFEEHPFEYKAWVTDKDGEALIEILTEKWRSGVKVPKSEEREIAKHYREQLKIIEEKRSSGIGGFINYQSWQ